MYAPNYITYSHPCCIPPEGYSEGNIVLNEDGIRNVTGEVVFFTEQVEILKVLYDRLLREGNV